MNPNSSELKNILIRFKTIAVVGLSDDQSRPSFNVANYLKDNGYKIIPVNPSCDQVLDEKCYSDLKAIDCEIDIVDIFRRSEFVPDIVEQAIEIGAKCIWMQDGVINECAAATARAAGLEVIMDDCILRQHKLLI